MSYYLEDIFDDCSLIFLSLLGMLAFGFLAALMIYLPTLMVPQAALLYVVDGAIAVICMCGILLLGRYLSNAIRDLRKDVRMYRRSKHINL